MAAKIHAAVWVVGGEGLDRCGAATKLQAILGIDLRCAAESVIR